MVAFFGLSAQVRTQFYQLFAPQRHYSFTETHQRKRATRTGKSTQVSEDGGFFLTVLLLAWFSARNLLSGFFLNSRAVEGGKYNCPTNLTRWPESCYLSQMQVTRWGVLISFRVRKRALREAHGSLSSMLAEWGRFEKHVSPPRLVARATMRSPPASSLFPTWVGVAFWGFRTPNNLA